jgi:hypothetical protein
MKFLKVLFPVLLALTLAACSFDKKPAEDALKAAAAAVEGVRAEGSKYAADQFKQLEDTLKSAQDAFGKGDYKNALAAAGGIAAKAKDVAAAATAKKEELTKSWEAFSAAIPQQMDAVKAKLESLAQAKKLPAGMDKDKLAGLRSSFDEVSKAFEDAKAAATGGDYSKAIEAGNAIKAKGAELAAALGVDAGK